MKRIQIVVSTLVAAVCFGPGCTFKHSIARHPIAYNMAVEDAENQGLLINILRAKDRKPRYFTAVTQFRGSLSGEIGLSAAIPFGGDATDVYGLSPSGAVKSSPGFDVAVLGSQEFHRGIQQQVSMETFQYYWDQGWPKEVLLYLLIRRIEINGDASDNAPGNQDEFEGFKKKISDFNLDRLQLRQVSKQVPVGVGMDEVPAADILSAHEKGLKVVHDRLGVHVAPSAKLSSAEGSLEVSWDVDSGSKVSEGQEIGQLCVGKESQTLVAPYSGIVTNLRVKGVMEHDVIAEIKTEKYWFVKTEKKWRLQVDKHNADGQTEEPNMKIFIRSPEAILYYLGELARLKLEGNDSQIPIVSMDSMSVPLFVVTDSKPKKGSFVSVKYQGQTYYIPESQHEGGRSSHCFVLLKHLFDLQKASKDLPTTSVVTVSGG